MVALIDGFNQIHTTNVCCDLKSQDSEYLIASTVDAFVTYYKKHSIKMQSGGSGNAALNLAKKLHKKGKNTASPPTPPSPPTLPDGWEAIWDPNEGENGNYYYHHESSGTVQWDIPGMNNNASSNTTWSSSSCNENLVSL